MGIVNKTVKNGENLWKYCFMVTDAHNKATLLPKVAYEIYWAKPTFPENMFKGKWNTAELGANTEANHTCGHIF